MAKTLTAFYDLKIGPVSFDVVPFLIRARMAAEASSCVRLHVVIVPHEGGVDGIFRDKLALYDAAEMHWRLWNIVIPACQLAGATVTLADTRERIYDFVKDILWPEEWDDQKLSNKPYLWGEIVEDARDGANVPRLMASEHARRNVRQWFEGFARPVVTLTLRHTYDASRNSSSGDWRGVLDALDDDFQIITISDTAAALTRGSGYAELSLDLRMAMYQEAAMNLHGNGGPAQLCWFSDAPYVMFGAAQPAADWQKFWKIQGMNTGDQLPWARSDQRLVYGPPAAGPVREILARLVETA